MTIEETIKHFKLGNKNLELAKDYEHMESSQIKELERYIECNNIAIRSLELWEKLIKFVDSERENNGTFRVHIDDIKKFYKEIKNDNNRRSDD